MYFLLTQKSNKLLRSDLFTVRYTRGFAMEVWSRHLVFVYYHYTFYFLLQLTAKKPYHSLLNVKVM